MFSSSSNPDGSCILFSVTESWMILKDLVGSWIARSREASGSKNWIVRTSKWQSPFLDWIDGAKLQIWQSNILLIFMLGQVPCSHFCLIRMSRPCLRINVKRNELLFWWPSYTLCHVLHMLSVQLLCYGQLDLVIIFIRLFIEQW